MSTEIEGALTRFPATPTADATRVKRASRATSAATGL